MGTRRALLGAIGALLLVLSGCSGDDGGGNEPTAAEDVDFAAAFSTVCLDVDRQIEALPEPVGLASLGDIARQAATITEEGVERLRAVEAPDELSGAVTELVDGLEAQGDHFTDLADAAGAGDRAEVDRISTEGETERRALAEQADALGVDCGLEGEEGVEAAPDEPGVATMDPTDAESPTVIPEFGDDPALDALARDCSGGNPQACDILSLSGAPGSGYEEYGGTCGGRNESLAADVNTFCIDLYPEALPPSADEDSSETAS